LSYYPFLFGIITFFSTMAGGLLAIKYHRQHGAIMALAAGVLIAVSLFDLLPESLKLATQIELEQKFVLYSVAAGFVFLLVVERYFSVKRLLVEGKHQNVPTVRGGWFAASEISVHSFIEGMAIGLSFDVNFGLGIATAVAIISHDFCDGINTVMVMKHSNNTARASFWMLILVALAPILGVAATQFITLPDRYLVLIIPFLVGGFLYLGASDCLPEAFEKNPPWVTVAFSIAGFLIILGGVRILDI
jgi:zinc transporter ZupT